jgi:Cu-processing system permease protein
VRRVLTIARLTFLEARRRRIVPAAVLGGVLFLAVYGIALYFILRNMPEVGPQRQMVFVFITIAGLYVANFLVIASAVLLPVDTLSGEIDSGVMQTLASKPVHRAEIVLGKWLAFLGMIGAYLALTAGGVLAIVYVLAGYTPPNMGSALLLMLLGAVLMITVTLAGGARFSTVTNGIVAFAFYGIAFIGGWVEQIGSFTSASAARYIGTAISLLSPVDALWRRASYELQPPLLRSLQVTPFSLGNVPSDAMILWSLGFCVVVLALALRWLKQRPL